MPNVSQVLKEEVRRLARKEVRAQAEDVKKRAAEQRREIAGLKREVASLERQLRSLHGKKQQETEVPADPELIGVRFSPRSVRAQRRRTGLSAEDYGALLGVSGQTVYLWEQGKARPREAQLKKLVELRGIGKREARARLEKLNTKQPRKKR